ncbi:MAG: DNA mismatch repair protein MutS [Candidatus Hodarchaeales archaeon]|jgi:DNA mismatch repair protein MutS
MVETPAMKQWRAIRKKHSDCVIFFQMGDFYEFFNEDAIEMSRVLEIKLTSRGKGENSHPLAGIPLKAIDQYLPKLLEKRYSVAIANQTESSSKVQGKLLFGRDVVEVLSPGAVTNPIYLDQRKNNYLLSLFEGEKKYGFSLIDISTGQFVVGETSDCRKELIFDEITKYRPAEVLLPSSQKENPIVYEMRNLDSKLTVNFASDTYFYYPTAREILTSFFKVSNLEGFGLDDSMKTGIIAAGTLLNYLIDRKFKLDNVEKLSTAVQASGMVIDSIARRNLELERNLRDGEEKSTLIESLDQSKTSMGTRLLRNWLKEPETNVNRIQSRLDAVEVLMQSYILREDLREKLSRIIDLERFGSKLMYRKTIPRDVLALTDSLRTLPQIKTLLKPVQNRKLESIERELDSLGNLVSLIESALDENAGSKLYGCIKSGYNKELDDARQLSMNGKTWLTELEVREQEKINNLAQNTNVKPVTLKLGYTDGQGYFFELTNRAKKLGLVPTDYKIFRSLKNSTRYMNDELENLASKVLNAEEEIQKLEFELYNDVLEKISQELNKIKKNGVLISEIDVLANFADISANRNYCKPIVKDNTRLMIKRGRHPVVEQILPDGSFIPNDILLDTTDSRLLVVTGANMGGKSTYLRQVALNCIMAQIGCFIPADSAEIGIIDRIFTRVGVVDDITRNQSHFMVEMNETANILNNATSKSLILLDEIGRGTSTSTGLAIAWSVAKYLHSKVKAKTLFATHFHQLNAMEKYFHGTKNFHVTVKQEKSGRIVFLHEIRPGGTNESYGLEVATMAGIPSEVIEGAREIRDSLEEEEVIEEKDAKPSIKKARGTLLEFFHPTEIENDEKSHLETDSRVSSAIKRMKKDIETLNLSNMTPVDAFNFLIKMQKELKSKETKKRSK